MRTRLRFFICSLCVGLSGIPATVPAQCWVYQKNDTAISLSGIAFPDVNVGVAVGDAGSVLRTTDGGAHWHAQPTNPYFELQRLSFSDAASGTVVGFDYYEQVGLILHTTDAGITWIRQICGTPSPLRAVAVPTADVAVAVGFNGTILRTTNGGLQWKALPSGTTEDLIGVCFVDALRGTVVGTGGTILHTTNGGASWERQQSQTSISLYDVSFLTADQGIIVGNRGTILRTSDGGATWRARNVDPSNVLISLSLNTPEQITLVGWNSATHVGRIFRTSDGGSHWDSVDCPTFLYAVASPYGDAAVGEGGTIVHLSDSCSPSPQALLLSPPDGSEHQSLIPLYDSPPLFRFTWRVLPSLDVAGTQVQVSSNETLTRDIIVDTFVPLQGSLLTTTLSVKSLTPGTTYFWRARTRYWDNSSGAWSDIWRFTTGRGVISGTIFEDSNKNQIQDAGEMPFPHWRVDVSGSVEGSVFTDANGLYAFRGLGIGTYVIREQGQSPLLPSVPSRGYYSVGLGASDTVTTCDFGNYYGWNTAGGTLFHDLNDNGVQDDGETGLPAWTVVAQNNNIDSVLTDPEGKYVFPHLVLGQYSITAVMKRGWEQTYPQLDEHHGVYFSNYGQSFDETHFAVHMIPPRVKIILTVKDSTTFARRKIWFGVRPGASDGIWGIDTTSTAVDFSEGEFELPPQLPGLFDARFVDPRSGTARFGYGSWTDMRGYASPSQVDTFRIQFQPGLIFGGDYPMLVSWSKLAVDTSFEGDVMIADPLGKVVDMKLVDSLLVSDPSAIPATIVAHGPRMPVVGVEVQSPELPAEFALLQNYPNPFNSVTVIRYEIPQAGARNFVPVRLAIYNLLGQTVATLVDEVQEAGYKSVAWAAGNVPSGVYFYRLTAGPFTGVKKLVLLK